jgi:hypothetical protein
LCRERTGNQAGKQHWPNEFGDAHEVIQTRRCPGPFTPAESNRHPESPADLDV